MPVEEVAELWHFTAEEMFIFARYGVIPVIWSPDERMFFFDRRIIESSVDAAHADAAEVRAANASPEDLRAIWSRWAEARRCAGN